MVEGGDAEVPAAGLVLGAAVQTGLCPMRGSANSGGCPQDPLGCCWSRSGLALLFCKSPGGLRRAPVLAGGVWLFDVPFAEWPWACFAGTGWSGGLRGAGGGLSSLSLSPRPSAFINNEALAGSRCRDHHQVPGTCLNRACRLCPPSPGICTHQPPPRSNWA